ncbi:unnamed protein product, partial [Coregonus sp. 'balchen']
LWFPLGFRFGDECFLSVFTGFVSVKIPKKPQDHKFYMVTIPAVIQAGLEAKICARLLQPNETLVMTISRIAKGRNKILLQESSDQEFHLCFQFQAPQLQEEREQNFKVEVRCETFLSTEERKVMIKPYSPMTAQIVHFRVMSLDTNFCTVNQLYNIVELEDVNRNRIGQWVNTTSSGKILQFSHPLNSKSPKGTYYVIVWIGENKILHSFKVEQYVLPKFEIKLNLSDEISVGQEEYKVDMAQTGCASHVFNMSTFKDDRKKIVRDDLIFNAKIEEGGTISASLNVAVVHFNDTPISNKSVYLFEGQRGSAHHLQNLTTDSHGIVSFSLNTTGMPKDDIALTISHTLELGEHRLSLIQPTAPHSKTSSSLAIQKMEKPLACGEEGSITIHYTIVGETVPRGSVDFIYLALSRGVIVQHGYMKVAMQESSVTEGEVTVKLAVVPEMAPLVQVLVYSMLPSETVIAHIMDFPTEKCFRHNVMCVCHVCHVLVEFSPSKAVPGEEKTLQLSAQPGSLCGLSDVDQSVRIMEPGKGLDSGKVSVTPVHSLDYTLTPLSDIQYSSSCLFANGRKTFSWTMAPSVLEAVQSHVECDNEIVIVPERGRIATVTRTLLVKAEGNEQTETYNWLLCPT